MADDNIVSKWNEVMEGFKINENFFKESNAMKIIKALEELCVYCKLNVPEMKQYSQYVLSQKFAEMNLAPLDELEPVFNILKFIFRTYAIITTGQKAFCLYDVYSIGPKRLNRIFRELFNFFLFCKIQNNKITSAIESRETKGNDIMKENEELDMTIDTLEKEIKAIDAKMQKCKSTFPQTEAEVEVYKQQHQDVLADVKELEAKVEAEEEALKLLLEEGMKTQIECDDLKNQLVTDSEFLTKTLESLKQEHEELVKQNELQEASLKSKINLFSEKTKSIALANDLMSEFNKCVSLGDKCKEIAEKDLNVSAIDESEAANIEKKYKEALNSLNANKKKFDELSAKHEELNRTVPVQYNEIIKEIHDRLEEKTRLENEEQELINTYDQVEKVIEEIENCKQEEKKDLERFEKLVLDLINDMYQRTINFSKATEEKYRDL